MEQTFNMGIGMVAVVAPEDADRAMAVLTARHIDSWVLGEVRAADDASKPPATLHVSIRVFSFHTVNGQANINS